MGCRSAWLGHMVSIIVVPCFGRSDWATPLRGGLCKLGTPWGVQSCMIAVLEEALFHGCIFLSIDGSISDGQLRTLLCSWFLWSKRQLHPLWCIGDMCQWQDPGCLEWHPLRDGRSMKEWHPLSRCRLNWGWGRKYKCAF